VRVDSEVTFGGGNNLRGSAWYAPNVGLLKLTTGAVDSWLLESITPGEKQ
jgi:hypothetical protein